MAYGMKVLDATGVVMFDETDRVPAIHGSFSYSFGAGVQQINVSVSGILATTHFAFDPAGAALCRVTTGSVQLTRVRASYSATESGTFTVFRC